MVRTRSRIYSTYILLLDDSVSFHERFISRRSLGDKITDSIIASKKGISIDPAYDEMISEMLDDFTIRGWQTYLLKCLNDEILNAKYSEVINTNIAPRELNCLNDEMIAKKYTAEMNTNTSHHELYYYGLPGDEHDQALFSATFPNTRAMFLTCSLRSII